VVQFRRGKAKVDGHENRSEAGAGQVELDELRTVLEHDRYPVAFFNPQGLKPAAGAVGSLMKLKIRDLLPFKEDSGFIGMKLAPPLHPPGNVHGFDHRRTSRAFRFSNQYGLLTSFTIF
jgi:hypothetical protein